MEKPNKGSEKEEDERIREAILDDIQCTQANTGNASRLEMHPRMAGRQMRATRETLETLAILAIPEIPAKLETREIPETLGKFIGAVKVLIRVIGPRWTTNDRTRIILPPPHRTHLTAPPTKMRPPNVILPFRMHLPRDLPALLPNPTTPRIELE